MILFIKFKYYYYKFENRKQFDITLFVYACIFLLTSINSFTIIDIISPYDNDLSALPLYDDYIFSHGLSIIYYIIIFKDCRLIIKKDILNYTLICLVIILFLIWVIFERNIYSYSILLLKLFGFFIFNIVFLVLFRLDYKNKVTNIESLCSTNSNLIV